MSKTHESDFTVSNLYKMIWVSFPAPQLITPSVWCIKNMVQFFSYFRNDMFGSQRTKEYKMGIMGKNRVGAFWRGPRKYLCTKKEPGTKSEASIADVLTSPYIVWMVCAARESNPGIQHGM